MRIETDTGTRAERIRQTRLGNNEMQWNGSFECARWLRELCAQVSELNDKLDPVLEVFARRRR